MNILICTDGSSGSVQSAELVSKLAFPKETQITILGVSENEKDVDKLGTSMGLIENILGTKYQVNRKFRSGKPIQEIMSEVLESSYKLVAVGGGGSQLGLLHPKIGSTTGKLARKLHTHFLVARNLPEKLTKILVCTGADSSQSTTIKLGGEWISNTSAHIGLLHVRPTDPSKETKPKGKPESENSAINTFEKPEPQLNQSVQQLRDAGVKTQITPMIRQGLVVEEVMKELNDGAYELLVVGAHYQPGHDRWQGVLLDDVTDQLLNRCTCSVLII